MNFNSRKLFQHAFIFFIKKYTKNPHPPAKTWNKKGWNLLKLLKLLLPRNWILVISNYTYKIDDCLWLTKDRLVKKSVSCVTKICYHFSVSKLLPQIVSIGVQTTIPGHGYSKIHVFQMNHYSALLDFKCEHYYSCTLQTLKKNK